MKQIVLNDTNIFIDLHDVGLLDEFFRLPWEVHTTDFVISELQQAEQQAAVSEFEVGGKLHVVKFGFDEIVEINKLKQLYGKNTNVSLTDCSVWYYAKQNGCTLLSGDCKLRNSAMSDGVDVKGILYVFDMLVGAGAISSEIASKKLTLLKAINPRLPENEIKKRLKQWNGEQIKERRRPMED